LEVVPTKDELLEADTFLNKIPKRGHFRNVHLYLDCNFRLLKEDASRPLRKGV
jgi:hypothetical protein